MTFAGLDPQRITSLQTKAAELQIACEHVDVLASRMIMLW